MSNRYHYKQIVRLLATGALAGICSPVWASGFQIMEQNVTNLGTAYAGTASLAADASTGFYNSAGLTRIYKEQIALSLVGISPQSKVDVTRATASTGALLGSLPARARGRGDALVPGIHYAYRWDDNWALGLNIVSPFGLKTKYRDDSIVRYMSTRTDLRTYDIAPSVAYCLGNGFSLGLGVDIVHLNAQFDFAAGAGVVATDVDFEARASRWGVGGHAGLLYEFSDCTRLGLNYRSQVRFKPKGSLSNDEGEFASLSTNRVTLPDTAVLSAFHQLNECWALMADFQWTNWSKFSNVALLNDSFATRSITTTYNFKDSYRAAIGASYQYDDCWLFRLGAAYDASPVRDQFRTNSIPDSDRTWVAVGARYQFTKCLAMDVGYAHLFFKNASINQPPPAITTVPAGGVANQTLTGRYKTHADILGLQLTWDLG